MQTKTQTVRPKNNLPIENVSHYMKEFWQEIEPVMIGRKKEIKLMFAS